MDDNGRNQHLTTTQPNPTMTTQPHIPYGYKMLVPSTWKLETMPDAWVDSYNNQTDYVNRAIDRGYQPTIEAELNCRHAMFVMFQDIMNEKHSAVIT